jgi:hypothetical protein
MKNNLLISLFLLTLASGLPAQTTQQPDSANRVSIPTTQADWILSMVGANPVITDLQANLDLASDTRNFNLIVFDQQGRVLYSKILQLVRGDNPIDVEVSEFPVGTYILHLTDGRSSRNLKWQKI